METNLKLLARHATVSGLERFGTYQRQLEKDGGGVTAVSILSQLLLKRILYVIL